MAETEDILRLGIEAAREGNREEARGLFTLLTRQEPDNVQAWLWLAGVAEGPDQRRAALEQVVRLEPENEMALKGLQAMGVTPAPAAAPSVAAPSVAAPSVVAEPAVAAAAAPARDLTDEEAYAAELDSAFDLADELPRAAPPPRREPDPADVAGLSEEPRLRSTPRVRTTTVRDDDDDDMVAARSGPSPLMWLLLGLLLLALLAGLIWQLFFAGNQSGGEPTVGPVQTTVIEPTADPAAPTVDPAAPTADPNAPAPTVDPNAPTPDPNAPAPTADPNAPAPTVDPNAPTPDPNAPAPTADPNAPAAPAPAPPGPVTGANPLIIPANAVISANNWNYTYPGTNVCAFGCAVLLGNQAGGFTASGTFLHVLVFVQNNTGTAQPLPPEFFVLKDAQGRIHEARVDVAAAAYRPGSADASHAGNIPANGGTTSVYLVFDVPQDATDLVLFSRYFIDQGWQVAASVR